MIEGNRQQMHGCLGTLQREIHPDCRMHIADPIAHCTAQDIPGTRSKADRESNENGLSQTAQEI